MRYKHWKFEMRSDKLLKKKKRREIIYDSTQYFIIKRIGNFSFNNALEMIYSENA